MSAGTFLGEAALRKGEAYTVTAQAVEPTVMLLFLKRPISTCSSATLISQCS